MTGLLYIVSTPLGNLGDMTRRALTVLRTVDYIAAENPEETRRLLQRYRIWTPLTSYNSSNMKEKVPILINRLRDGRKIALVCDSGTPTICDPGSYLVSRVRQAGIAISPVPGASAVQTALSVSGFNGDAYVFFGALSPNPRTRGRILKSLQLEHRTAVIFVPSNLLATICTELRGVLGRRRMLACMNMTTEREAYIGGTLRQVEANLKSVALGESLTFVIEGKHKKSTLLPPLPR